MECLHVAIIHLQMNPADGEEYCTLPPTRNASSAITKEKVYSEKSSKEILTFMLTPHCLDILSGKGEYPFWLE